MKFEIVHRSKKSKAKVGRIHTAHGIIDTPNFVAVGTNGVVKGLDSIWLEQIELQLMFCNTYHLLLQPGKETIRKSGGLHKFMNRSMPLITDSGGFQVFSLAYGSVADELKSKGLKKQDGGVIKINEDGVLFRSYRDGSKVLLTPELSIQAQKDLGADIIIPFDELPPYHISKDKLVESLERTHRWEERSLIEHKKDPRHQFMYGVIHGGIDPELRSKSAQHLSKLNFDGYAIGGSMGKTKEQMYEMLTKLMPEIEDEKPTHLLGIGDIGSIDKGVTLGIDTFDSAYPTRAARHGMILTQKGPYKLGASAHGLDFTPLEEGCDCYTCKHFTKSYLLHLFKAKELSFYSLASLHNLRYMMLHMKRLRQSILNDEI